MDCVAETEQREQVCDWVPDAVHVAALVTVHEPQLWPRAAFVGIDDMTVLELSNIVEHLEHV